MEEKVLKRTYIDKYFQSFQDIFSVPYSYNKCTPYSSNRVSQEVNLFKSNGLERQTSEKCLYDDLNQSDYNISISSAESKSQLPLLKHKNKSKKIGLPYQMEINRNKKFMKSKNAKTSYNWFPDVRASQKIEENPKKNEINQRPSTCSSSNKRNESAKNPKSIQSHSNLKPEPPNSNRGPKQRRVVLKSNSKNLVLDKNIQESEEKKCEDDISQKKNTPDCFTKKPGKAKKAEKKKSIAEIKVSAEKAEVMLISEQSEKKSEKPGKKEPKEKKEKKEEKIEKSRKNVPAVSEIVTRHRNFNLNQLLNNKTSDFKSLMQEYLRRQGLSENTKVFIISGQYEYLRKLLVSKGWVENTHQASQAYDLKWTYNDSDQDYKFLRPGQFFNHFPGNRELTTKSGLLKNLRAVMEYGNNVDDFYPRSYDLGETTQLQEFQQDYIRTSVFNVVKHFAELFKTSPLPQTNAEILKIALRISEKYLDDLMDDCETQLPEWEFSESLVKQVVDFSEKGFSCTSVEETSQDQMKKTHEIYLRICECFPQSRMEGKKNIWIVKPGLNSRGSGVRCMQGLTNILEYGANIQARVIQKYIESPLLINSNKFDIRQWVLVTSYEPLTVYFFDNCYLRLCQMPFNLDSLEAYRHLANYSLQKNIAKNQEDTVWSLPRFIAFLEGIGKSWEEILEKIHRLVIKTLKAVKENIESRVECFELYGFDIILDEICRPWLLEVNLSPACSERTEWLSEMLNEMSSGLIEIVFEGLNLMPIYDCNLKKIQSYKSANNKWLLIYKGDDLPQGDLENVIYAQLEIIGEKVNVKKEKNYDKKVALAKSAIVIQKCVRGYLVRVKILRRKENKLAENVQRMLRRAFAYEMLEKQFRLVCCIKIQTNFRMFRAKKELNRLKVIQNIKLIQARLKGFFQRNSFKTIKIKKSVLCIQKSLRKKIASETVKDEKKKLLAALKIQKLWKKFWKNKNFFASKIQKFWKAKFLWKVKMCIKIQKTFKGFLVRKKNINLQSIKSNAKKIALFYYCFISKELLNSMKRKRSIQQIIKLELKKKSLKILSYFHCFSAALKIQKHFKRYLATKEYKSKISNRKQDIFSSNCVKRHIIGYLSRQKFRSQLENASALKIQKIFKGFQARKYFNFLIIVNESAKIIQRKYRRFRAYRKFKMQLRILTQEIERKKRIERLRHEQEIKAQKVSERLYSANGALRPASLKSKIVVQDQKISKIKIKKSKSKGKKDKSETSFYEEFDTFLPRTNTLENNKLKKKKFKSSPKDVYGMI